MPVSNQFIENGLKFIARGLGRVGHVLEGKPHIPEKVVQELKEAPHFFKHYARGFIKARGQFVKSLKEDSRYIRIHAAHPDPKIAEVGQIIDEMLNNPLVKKFRRNKIHFFISPSQVESEAEHLNGPLRNVLKTLSAATESASAEMKTVCIPAHHFEKMSVAELKGLLGHEMGHVVRQDTHVRRGLEMFRRTNQASERLADDIGVYLSKEPEAMKAGLDKTCQLQEEAIKNLPNNFWARVQKRYMRNFTSDKSTATYPSLSERKRAIDTMAGRISTSEGRSHVEAELSRRLETEHRKLFPHHFSRI